jgi:restriction system protein
LNDVSIPVEELRRYLLVKYSDRFNIHPKKYEEIVGSVFSDFGYRVRVTSYSGDEGIDIFIFDGDNDSTVGIQVKRYKGNISAEQIRSFIGALVLKGITKGVYVTTSEYQKGAERAAAIAQSSLGIGVNLLDSEKFYDAMKIATRSIYWEPEDISAPYFECWKNMTDNYIPAKGFDGAPQILGFGW